MEQKLQQLKAILAEVSDIRNVLGLMGWDQQVVMPVGGAVERGNQTATLSRLAHIRFTSDEVGKLLSDLQPYAAQLDPDSDDARFISVTQRLYDKQVKVPAEMVAEMAGNVAVSHHIWEKARAENDFASFRPALEKIVDLRKEYAALFAPYDHVYDPLLDDYEPGLKTADVKAIFAALRPQQVELLKEITARLQVADSFIYQPYDRQKQWDFGVEVVTCFGMDWNHSRQDKAVHPFTQSMNVADVRITTRVLPDNVSSALFSTMHETGHALYELGVDPALERTPLARGASLALHESQSRMWENLVGRSFDFWTYFYPRLQKTFPTQLNNVDLMTFYKGINRVQPSMIRVEADEATYNMHIMLRLELEIAIMEGRVEVKHLPDAWNTRMQEYLGVTPATDSEGVLQDVHWSNGLFGYFSTYALGNLISAQLWEKMHSDMPGMDEQIRSGKFNDILQWLRTNIHHHGAKFEPQELVQRVTGSKIDPTPYVNYLRRKYSQIYGF